MIGRLTFASFITKFRDSNGGVACQRGGGDEMGVFGRSLRDSSSVSDVERAARREKMAKAAQERLQSSGRWQVEVDAMKEIRRRANRILDATG